MLEPSMNSTEPIVLYLPFLSQTQALRTLTPLQERLSNRSTLNLVFLSSWQTTMLKQVSSEFPHILDHVLVDNLCGNARKTAKILSKRWEDTNGKPTPVRNSTPGITP